MLLIIAVMIWSMQPGIEVDGPWGFFGHRKINRMAVFTLPPEMLHFYKRNIEYITEHSIDPDKRRYATVHEAVRHYIDIDHWGEYPFDNVPRKWADALIQYSDIEIETENGRVVFLDHQSTYRENNYLVSTGVSCALQYDSLRQIFQELVLPNYYDGPWHWTGTSDGLLQFCEVEVGQIRMDIRDRFSEHGILPYCLLSLYHRLSDALFALDANRILRLSTELGHYLADAHVPLHTTKNYNGQLTDQLGIHAFWESRLPELFADEHYDFFVGKPDYIQNPGEYFWEVVLESHQLLEGVLAREKELSREFPADQQYCFEERLDRTVRVPCFEYSKAYHSALGEMVEKRMQDAIHGVASVWYTAWVNAGQPDLKVLVDGVDWSEDDQKEGQELDNLYKTGKQLGREHHD